MENEKRIDKICSMLDDLVAASKRSTKPEPVEKQVKTPDFYLGYKTGYEAAQPKWISVEERLPEDDVNVLAYIAGKKENVDSVIAITRYTHSMHGFNIEGWCSPWQYCFWDREVTHWMSLPPAPNDNK